MAAEPAEPTAREVVSPSDAFALLGHEIRLDVLRVLFEASGGPLGFADLRRRVGVRDSGRVNYHITELRPHFVERTDEGYALRRPGYNVVRVLRAGTVTSAGELDPVALDADCVRCDGRPELRYRDQFALVGCPECGHWFVRYVFPPGALADRSADEVAAALDQRCRSLRRLGNAGVCELCSGPMTRRLAPDECFGHAANVVYECERCGCQFHSTVGAALADHPAVVALHHDHGVDLRERRLWGLGFAFDSDRLAVVESDPRTVALTVPVPVPVDGGESEVLELRVDADATVAGDRAATLNRLVSTRTFEPPRRISYSDIGFITGSAATRGTFTYSPAIGR